MRKRISLMCTWTSTLLNIKCFYHVYKNCFTINNCSSHPATAKVTNIFSSSENNIRFKLFFFYCVKDRSGISEEKK